ncbi:hypothetical protein BMS3Abin05_02540 [bacterium BMS3Abin05]|nr:hypothetical protein BMS3Abin05_02540 [bacterium BMS3Abin05]GBE27509.1 hypothetical protein BMS3Bbin03_01436 [bacterium BMS3Bbin03]
MPDEKSEQELHQKEQEAHSEDTVKDREKSPKTKKKKIVYRTYPLGKRMGLR